MNNYWSVPITSTIVAVQSYAAGISTNHAIIDSASSLLFIGKSNKKLIYIKYKGAFNGLISD